MVNRPLGETHDPPFSPKYPPPSPTSVSASLDILDIKDVDAVDLIHASRPYIDNFRDISLMIGGNKIMIGGSAQLRGHTMMSDFKGVLSQFKSMGFKHVIALDERWKTEVSEAWCSDDNQGGEYKLFNIEDYEAPELKDLMSISNFVKSKAIKGENVTIFCGEGWGRTGTVMASLALRHLMESNLSNQTELNEYVSKENKLTGIFELYWKDGGGSFPITRFVEEAIEMIRTSDEDSRAMKAGPFSNGHSVETNVQVKVLLELENAILTEMINPRRSMLSRVAAWFGLG